MKAYSNTAGLENVFEETEKKFKLDCQNPENRFLLNPQAVPFQPHLAPSQTPTTPEQFSLTQALVRSLTLNCLPMPELIIFTGDPLKFTGWKISFMTLIDQKPLPVSEKMFYLKNYLAGEARKAVEGFFYRNSEDAYRGAWAVLEDRYGSPFIVQRAFRHKLARWPKITANNPTALREFADFLQGCVEAIPHVKGLTILNDCEENQRLVNKLPEWMVYK